MAEPTIWLLYQDIRSRVLYGRDDWVKPDSFLIMFTYLAVGSQSLFGSSIVGGILISVVFYVIRRVFIPRMINAQGARQLPSSDELDELIEKSRMTPKPPDETEG